MTVLHVINSLVRGGGAEKFLIELSIALKEKNVNVEILSILAPPEGNRDYLNILEKKGIPVHILTTGKLRSWKNINRLRNFIKTHNYSIVHGHLFPTLYFCSCITKKNIKLIYTEHSTDNKRRHYLFFRFLDRFVYQRYHRIVCISNKVQVLLSNHVKSIQSLIIPNGINTSLILNAEPIPLNELGIYDTNIKFVTMCARFVKGKDYMTLFRSLKWMPENIHILCIGTGPLEDRYRQYCNENQLSSRVHFLGLRKDVPQILKRSDVIVLSSEHEGFSLSMLEAMASGTPFIASAVPGLIDLIEGYAVLFPFGDEQALATSILRLLNDRIYRKEMIEKNSCFAKQFDILTTAEQYKILYTDLIEKNTI